MWHETAFQLIHTTADQSGVGSHFGSFWLTHLYIKNSMVLLLYNQQLYIINSTVLLFYSHTVIHNELYGSTAIQSHSYT